MDRALLEAERASGLTGLVRCMADRAAGDQAGTSQYRARKCSHGGRHPCGLGPGLSYLAQREAAASKGGGDGIGELHIADVILRRGEKYEIKLDRGRHDGRVRPDRVRRAHEGTRSA